MSINEEINKKLEQLKESLPIKDCDNDDCWGATFNNSHYPLQLKKLTLKLVIEFCEETESHDMVYRIIEALENYKDNKIRKRALELMKRSQE